MIMNNLIIIHNFSWSSRRQHFTYTRDYSGKSRSELYGIIVNTIYIFFFTLLLVNLKESIRLQFLPIKDIIGIT